MARRRREHVADPNPVSGSRHKSDLKEKWGESVVAAGWTPVPNVLIRGQRALGLTPMDLSVLLQLLTYWWKKDNLPYVGKRAMAAAIGVDERHVRRRLKALQERGYISVERRKGHHGGDATSAFRFDGLIEAMTKLAVPEVERIAERQAKRTRRFAKRPVVLRRVR